MIIRRLETEHCQSTHPIGKTENVFDIPFESDEHVKMLEIPCGKPIQIEEEHELPDGKMFQKLRCGHWRIIPKALAIEHKERNLLWDNLFPFQKEFVHFWEKSPRKRVILRDQMGLGKTVQVLSTIRENIAHFTCNSTKYCVIAVLPGAVYQWEEECNFWFGLDKPKSIEQITMMPQLFKLRKQQLSPLSNVVIVPWTRLSDPDLQKQLTKRGIGSIIVDECHFYKNRKSARTKALIELFKIAGNDVPAIFMSGTLVENRIDEMEIALHLCDPEFFSTPATIQRFIEWDYINKRPLGISRRFRDHFFNRVNKYMIGRSKEEAGVPLPKFENHRVDFDPFAYKANDEIAKQYDASLDELERLLETPEVTAATIMGIMAQLRHVTGRLKLLPAAIWIAEWLKNNPGEKITIGIHHQWVRKNLAELLKIHNPLTMSDEDAEEKDAIEKEFKTNPERRLLIASIISAGTGRNLQFCRNAVIMERQWNRSREDQFKERFHRILRDDEGRVRSVFTDKDTVHLYTMNGTGTFDEYFDAMVDLKGIITDSSDENVEELPPLDFVIELAQMMVSKRRKYLGV